MRRPAFLAAFLCCAISAEAATLEVPGYPNGDTSAGPNSVIFLAQLLKATTPKAR